MIIPKIDFPIYTILILSSLIIGMIYIYYSIEKKDYIYLYFFLCILFSLIFGKLLNVLISNGKVSFINAGLSSYGGFIGVILSSIIFENIVKIKGELIKYSIISLPLIYGISKIGCFLTGCCYGIPYDGFLSVTYANGLNIPLFPIQVIESIVFIVLFFLCNRFKNNKQIVWLTILFSASAKFVLDFFRYEHITNVITINQVISISLIIVTIIAALCKKNSIKKQKIFISLQ